MRDEDLENILKENEESFESKLYLTETQRMALNELFSFLIDTKYITPYQNVALTSLRNQLNKY